MSIEVEAHDDLSGKKSLSFQHIREIRQLCWVTGRFKNALPYCYLHSYTVYTQYSGGAFGKPKNRDPTRFSPVFLKFLNFFKSGVW